MEFKRNDAILMEIMKEKRSFPGFLEAVFGFLARKTDFYLKMKNETDNMGLPDGYKEHLVLKVLRQFEPFPAAKAAQAAGTTATASSKDADTNTHIVNENSPIYANLNNVAAEVEIKTSSNNIENIPEIEIDTKNPLISNKKIEKSSTLQSQSKPSSSLKHFLCNEHYNGAVYEKYCWSQTVSELEVHILLPKHITSSKHLAVTIETEYIKILDKVKNLIMLEGKLLKKCKHNDSVWSISGNKLQLTLDKIQEIWWNKFLDTEPEIDLTKMDCSRSIDELPEDQQAVIEKLKWDQKQKLLGLPTSDDVKTREILEKAWQVESSPFKGQPFDPSSIKFN